MATFFTAFFKHPPQSYSTHRLEGNSEVILHCCGREQSSPFMDASMGIREGKEEGWRERGGRRSRLSFQCGEAEGETQQNMCFQMFKQSHTHTARLSVFTYSVKCKDLHESGYRFTLTPPI